MGLLLALTAGNVSAIPIYPQVIIGSPFGGGTGGGGGGGGLADPGANGIVVRTALDVTTARTATAGIGLVVTNGDGQSGNPTFDYDSAIIPNYASGTGACPATGSIGTFYFRTDVPTFCLYPATDSEYWSLILPLGTGTSGGIPYFTGTANLIASSAALTANLPVIGGGAGAAPTVGTRSGNTTAYVTTTGSQTSGDCVKIDANGNHIANGSSCGGSAFDPSTTLTAYCDFVSGLNTNGNICESALATAAISSGTLTQVAGTAANPGLIRLASASANDNSGNIVLYSNGTALTQINSSTWDNKDWSLDAVFIPGTNSGAITNASWYFGLADVITETSANATKGIWIRWNADNSDTTYVFVVCNASGAAGCASAGDNTNAKTVASTITPVAGTANRLRIRRATSGVGGNPTIYFRVNDETEKTFCSSGCDDTLGTYTAASYVAQVSYYERATGTVLSGDLDYFYINIPGLVRY